MSELTAKLRSILQFYFDQGTNPAQAREEICAVYGEDTLSKATVKNWFSRFLSGNFDVQEAPRSGRPSTEKADDILAKIDQDRHITSHDIAVSLNMSHQAVLNHLEKAGYTKKLDVWVARDLTKKNLLDRIFICESLLKYNELDPFLKRLITSGERWITYDNNSRKRSLSKRDQQCEEKSTPTPKKILLCIWWDWEGIVHHELLPPGTIVDSDLYCQQLERLYVAIQKKRPKLASIKVIAYQADNSRPPHTSLTTRQKLREFGWEVLMHPANSPDLAPSDYHLFWSLQNSLIDAKLISKEACETHVSKFFDQKPPKFYSDGIMMLPEKWQKVIELNGAYTDS